MEGETRTFPEPLSSICHYNNYCLSSFIHVRNGLIKYIYFYSTFFCLHNTSLTILVCRMKLCLKTIETCMNIIRIVGEEELEEDTNDLLSNS